MTSLLLSVWSHHAVKISLMIYMHYYVRLEGLRLPQGAGLDTAIQMCMELNFWQLLAELNVDFRSHYTAFIDPNFRLI